MCEYKNNKSEAFTAVISLISLYNSVACHENTHARTNTLIQQYMYIQRCTHTHSYTHTKSIFFAKDGRKVAMGMDTQVTSLVKDRKGEKVKTHAHKKEKIYIYHSQKVSSPPSLFV